VGSTESEAGASDEGGEAKAAGGQQAPASNAFRRGAGCVTCDEGAAPRSAISCSQGLLRLGAVRGAGAGSAPRGMGGVAD
jgi:hypothetical protein